jgi:hypothetical protein
VGDLTAGNHVFSLLAFFSLIDGLSPALPQSENMSTII